MVELQQILGGFQGHFGTKAVEMLGNYIQLHTLLFYELHGPLHGSLTFLHLPKSLLGFDKRSQA